MCRFTVTINGREWICVREDHSEPKMDDSREWWSIFSEVDRHRFVPRYGVIGA